MSSLHPVSLSRDATVFLLRDIAFGFESGDTLEGSIEFLVDPDEPENWLVQASYRKGNLEGQGSLRIVGEWR